MPDPIRATMLLAPGYSWLAASLLIEPWRVANRLAGESRLQWQFTSWDAEPVIASNGLALPLWGRADHALDAPQPVMVVAGDEP